MADYIKKIRTEAGDLQIDYEALANKPQFDADWKAANNLADATVVNNKIKGVEDKVNAANTEIDQLAAAVEALGGDLGDIGSKGYITAEDLDGYVTETELEAKGYLTGLPVATTSSPGIVRVGSGLSVTSAGVISVDGSGSGTSSEDYVTETELLNKGYLTTSTLPIATTSTYGMVKPYTRHFYFDDSGYLNVKLGFSDLIDVYIVNTLPSSGLHGNWYLVPAGDG